MLKLLFSFLLLSSCAGYHLQSKSNPFLQYGINSIYTPVFYNHTNFPNVSGVFTKEIMTTLFDFKGLRLEEDRERADAVLIGILESDRMRRNSTETKSSKSASNVYKDTLGGREKEFFVASENLVKLSMRIIVIKHPTNEEIEFLQTQYGPDAMSSKIIFNERIRLENTVTIKELQGDGTKVLGTQNRGVQVKAFKLMAQNAAKSFKEMILHAF